MEQRGFVFQEENLLSPADAVATFLARVPLAPSGVERVALDDALGRTLAQTLAADDDYPNAPRSAMDGFALRAAEMPGSARVLGEIAMGSAWAGTLGPGEALRIPTGGVLPDGADAVVPIEDARLEQGRVHVVEAVAPGANVNPRAGDMRKGEPILHPGTRIGAPQLGVLATLGVTQVPVFRRPRIAVISSGDELIAPDAIPAPGEIRDSNRYAIAGSLRAAGAEVLHVPTVRDEPGALEAALRGALAAADAAILTGGSSVGERDHTPSAIAALGEPGVVVHGLRVKPGKPTVIGAVGGKPIIGLPGNPTSALLILEAVMLPILSAMLGSTLVAHTAHARLAGEARSRRGWTWFVPVALRHEGGDLTAHPLPLRSSAVSLTARADGYLTIPAATETLAVGTMVEVHRFI